MSDLFEIIFIGLLGAFFGVIIGISATVNAKLNDCEKLGATTFNNRVFECKERKQ